MTTEKTSVLKNFVPMFALVAPLVLGAVFAVGLGFTAPSAANADGINGGYTGVIDNGYSGGGYTGYIDNYDSGFGGGYTGYIDSYPNAYDSGYGGGYTGYIDNYGPSTFEYTSPSNYGPSTFEYIPLTYSYGNSGYSYYDPNINIQYYPSSYQPYYSDYEYVYEYDYDYYEYEYEYDHCTNIPGNQSRGHDCYPKTHDECSNISGNQPRGYDCHPDRDEELDCELTADDRTVEEGDEVTLEWDIDGDADYASINNGVGRVDEDGGEEDVEVDEDTTFRLTVRNGNDEATCSVTIRVDEENTFSSVDFEGEPANNPPQVVYLSSIPYTGLEDIDPALLSYWLMLVAGAGMLGWFLFRNGLIPTFAFAKSEPTDEGEGTEEAPVSDVPTTENAFVSALTDGDTDRAIDGLRDAVAHGASLEDTLEAAAEAAKGTALESRVAAALEASRVNGIRGVKAVLA